ncbi:tetratricopeptide repeat protein [Aquimarina sp. RZ0]|uniref:tetratricopeptide repeat protein n=1 Tax=Aquimarina sp. RZ0 TaxID=2607730 RepID=UPI0011F1D236|nr:hypothetical protein [Aquimarina sp. RZ0]KAA1247867.1 hypothetical protein F0000_01225 [Aquimarina sp. RZ0]
MKNLLLLFSLFVLVSCKSDKSNKLLKKHDHSKHIIQKVKNLKAINFYNKGIELLEQRKLDSAKTYLKKALEIEQSPIILNELGTIALNEENRQKALNYYNESIKQDLSYWPGHINKSRIFILESHFKSAEKTLKDMLIKCESDY